MTLKLVRGSTSASGFLFRTLGGMREDHCFSRRKKCLPRSGDNAPGTPITVSPLFFKTFLASAATSPLIVCGVFEHGLLHKNTCLGVPDLSVFFSTGPHPVPVCFVAKAFPKYRYSFVTYSYWEWP